MSILEETPLDPEEPEDVEEWDEPEPRQPRLSTTKERQLRRKIEDPISKIASWVSNRDEELGKILREDGPKMATLLSKLAASAATPPGVVMAVTVFASLLEPVDAFGRTLVHLWKKIRDVQRSRVQLYEEPVEEEPEEEQQEPEEPDVPIAEPWKINE